MRWMPGGINPGTASPNIAMAGSITKLPITAPAIITDAVGPAVRQSDGDSAHVRQMNRLARLLQQRLAYEQARR